MDNQELVTKDLEGVKNDRQKAEFIFARGKDFIDFANENCKHMDNKAYQLIGVLFLMLPILVAFRAKLLELGCCAYFFAICYGLVFLLLCVIVCPRSNATSGNPPKTYLNLADQKYSEMVASCLYLIYDACKTNLAVVEKKATCLKVALGLLFLSFVFLGIGVFTVFNV